MLKTDSIVFPENCGMPPWSMKISWIDNKLVENIHFVYKDETAKD